MRCAICETELPARSRFCFQCAAPATSEAAAPGDLAAALGDRYRILRLLGRGAMGAVHLARETALDRLVAIKTLPPESASSDDARERFRREARTAARLSHPSIVPLYAFGDEGGTLYYAYYAMGYVRGESLAARLAREGRLEPEAARTLLVALADALDYAHRQGVVHRDVKPDNVLVDDDTGRPLLADFGIAKGGGGTLTTTGSIVGTPHYMAPEQAAGRPVDGRSDLYALGVMGFRMLSGRLPFEGATVHETLARRIAEDAPPLAQAAADVPPDLAAAIDRCLARDPARRWPDGRSLGEALGSGRLPGAELPPALYAIESLAFWGVPITLGVAALAYGLQDAEFLESNTGLWAALLLLLPLPPLARLVRARMAGATWSSVARVIVRAPSYWVFWYPRALRRPRDVWERLPARVRRFRASMTGVFLYVAAGLLPLPVIVRVPSRGPDEMTLHWLVNALVALFLTAVFSFPLFAIMLLWQRTRLRRWALGAGLDEDEAHALIMGEPTAQGPFWSRPAVARLLEVDTPMVPSDPRACVSLIATAARGGPGTLRDLATEALPLAEALLTQIQEAEAAIARFGPAQVEQLARIEEDLTRLGADPGAEQQRMRALMGEQADLLRAQAARQEQARARRETLVATVGQLTRAVYPGRAHAGSETVRRALDDASALLGGGETRPGLTEQPTLPR